MSIIDQLADRQVTKTVKYKGLDDKQHERTVTMDKPGWKTSMQFADVMNKGDGVIDLSTVYQLIMQKVLTDKLTFNQEDKVLKEKYPDDLKKTISIKGEDGKDVDINIVFPGFRNAVRVAGLISKTNQDLNALDAFEFCIKYVFRNDKDSRFKSEFFDQFSLQDLVNLIGETMQYIAKMLNFDGFQSVMQEAITFLTKSSK